MYVTFTVMLQLVNDPAMARCVSDSTTAVSSFLAVSWFTVPPTAVLLGPDTALPRTSASWRIWACELCPMYGFRLCGFVPGS